MPKQILFEGKGICFGCFMQIPLLTPDKLE